MRDLKRKFGQRAKLPLFSDPTTNGYFIEYLVLAYTIELMEDLGVIR